MCRAIPPLHHTSSSGGAYSPPPRVLLSFRQKKGKVVPVLLTENHTMKAYRRSGSIIPRIL
jgi:hypothetical protein